MTVYGKTLMINYEGDLKSLMISILYFKLWLIVIKSLFDIGVCLVLGLIGWYDIELKCLEYVARLIKVYIYIRMVMTTNVPYYDTKY